MIAASDPAELVLEGTRAVLVEFPGFWLDLDDPIAVVTEAAGLVEEAGLVPVLAHPERCRPVAADPESVRPLAERGWLLCLNAPSLVGGHGATAERNGLGAARRRPRRRRRVRRALESAAARPPRRVRGRFANAGATRSPVLCSTAAPCPG